MNGTGGPSTVGEPSLKTLANLKRAKAYEWWWGPYHIEWKLWVGWVEAIDVERDDPADPDVFRRRWFFVWPSVRSIKTEFFNEGPVQWWRCYWLTFGISSTRMLPERRVGWRDARGLQRGRRRFDATEGGEHYTVGMVKALAKDWERISNHGRT